MPVKGFTSMCMVREYLTVYTDHEPLVSIIIKELHKIKNNRLRRMRTKLAIYIIDVKFIPGRKMVAADCLSRDYLISTAEHDKTIDEVVHSIESHDVEFSEDKLKLFQSSTLNDNSLKQVKKYYLEGWPTDKRKIEAGELYNYWSLRNNITVNNDLVYLHDGLIVPKKLRQFVVKLLHETHVGITKTL